MASTPTELAARAMTAAAIPAGDWIIVLPVVLPLAGAGILLMLRRAGIYQAGFAILVVLAVLLAAVQLALHVAAGGPVSMTMGNWLPPFGISFTVDLAGALFAAAAAAVTLVLLVYAQAERSGSDGRDGFFPLVLLLLAGVSGAFLTGDLFNLYVWFELMLIASFGLLSLQGRSGEIDGAVKYGFLNFVATTIFLLGLGLLYGLVGTLNMADIALRAPAAPAPAMTAIAALFLLAFGAKAAAFPVNAWLPASYHTPPAAVSALFAGLLTKVGAYALLRVLVALLPGSRDILEPVIAAAALATLVLAPLGALAETNLRRAIGFIVIGGIGAIVAGVALPSEAGIAGAVLYVFHAILTMTALYLVAGLVEHVTGATDSRRMGGLYAADSALSILFLVLILAAAGIPPFLGFWPKLLLLQASLAGAAGAGGWFDGLLAAGLVLNAFLTLLAGARLWAHIFWRRGHEGALSEHPNTDLRPLPVRARGLGLVPAAALVLAVAALGFWPEPLVSAGQAAARDLLQPGRYIAATGLAPDAEAIP